MDPGNTSWNNYPDGMDIDAGADMGVASDLQDYNLQEYDRRMMPPPDADFFTMDQPPPYNYGTEAMDLTESNDHGALQSPSPSDQSFIPNLSFTQVSTEAVPSHLRHDYDTYLASYVGNITFDLKTGKSEHNPQVNGERMGHAKALAFALLTHYYAASQGFVVQPCSLGPMAKHGMSFMLKPADGSDPDYTPLPQPKDAKKGKKKKKLSKAQKKAKDEEPVWHGVNFTATMKWNWTRPEDITGFVVMSKYKTSAEGTGPAEDNNRPLTYLAIMINDLTEFDQIAATNDIHRGDILADVLCRGAQIQTGYGILIFGTRIEFFDFDNGKEEEEPLVTMCEVEEEGDLAFDMRTTDWECVDRAFRHVAGQEVVYRDVPVLEDDQPNANNDGTLDAETEYGDKGGGEDLGFEYTGQGHMLEAEDGEN